MRRENADLRAHERQVHADALATTKQASERLFETQAAEISRLNEEFRDEMRKLTKVVAELNRRLNS